MVTLRVPRHWLANNATPDALPPYVQSVRVKEAHVDELAARLLLAGHKKEPGIFGSSPRIIDRNCNIVVLHKGSGGAWYLRIPSAHVEFAEE